MKVIFIISVCLSIFLSTGNAQVPHGALPNAIPVSARAVQGSASGMTSTHLTTDSFTYQTTTYTFTDLVVFSYHNGTTIYILDNTGTTIDSVSLNENQYHVFSPGAGIYTLEGNNPFSLLVGDPVTNQVLGYFAVDQSGRPLATRLNTYLPKDYYSGERFTVFAYENNTEFKIVNLSTNALIASGILNRGEHFELQKNFGSFLGVTANRPVSALSYTDQGYYIPATNGTFAGTEFFGFSGTVGGWPNGVIVIAYHDSTIFTIRNTDTGDTLWTDTLNTGEVYPYVVNQATYWQVVSNKTVTVCNTPYAYYSGSYYYLVRQMDESGRGIGTNFYAPVISGDLNVVSFEDSNRVVIVNQATGDTLANIILNKAQNYYMNTSKMVLHITSTKNISAISSYGGGFGADFMPLNYALNLPDLAISTSDIVFDPPKSNYEPGEPITIFATVRNVGNATAKDVRLQFFDGPPDAGNVISRRFYMDSLKAGDSARFSVSWTVPTKPEYHKVYVKTYVQSGQESSTSNNIASRPVIPNQDLEPPLSTTIKAPASVKIQGDTTEFREFDLVVTLFNASTVTATNARAILHIPKEWSVVDTSNTEKAFSATDSTVEDTIRYFGDIPAGETDSYTWRIRINQLPTGDAYYYSVDVLADNAELKNVKGIMQVEQPTAIEPEHSPVAPTAFRLLPAYPNPFNPSTVIPFHIARQVPVQLEVFDLTGQKVAVLVNEPLPPGEYRIPFNANQLSNGIYFVRLKAGQFVQTRKIVLMK